TGERMGDRDVEVGQRVFDELDALDLACIVRADRRDADMRQLREMAREMLELTGKIIVDEEDVHSGLIRIVLARATTWRCRARARDVTKIIEARLTRDRRVASMVAAFDDCRSTAATVKIETLSQGEAAAPLAGQALGKRPNDLAGLRLRAHIAGIGDVHSGSDEWIAGPEAPARIEGLAIEWPDKPADLA